MSFDQASQSDSESWVSMRHAMALSGLSKFLLWRESKRGGIGSRGTGKGTRYRLADVRRFADARTSALVSASAGSAPDAEHSIDILQGQLWAPSTLVARAFRVSRSTLNYWALTGRVASDRKSVV